MSFLALMLFVVSTSITPGPNNIMIMTSGVNYGIRKSIPHLLGIDLGFTLMVLLVGLGVSQVFAMYPVLFEVLKLVSVFYLLYLAYVIFNTTSAIKDIDVNKPMTFIQATLFQWVNPKAWTMALGAIGTFALIGEAYLWHVLIIALMYLILGTPCTLFWLWSGSKLAKLLQNPLKLKRFNQVMAILLVLSLTPVIVDLIERYL